MRRLLLSALCALPVMAALPVLALAEEIKPAIVFDMGGKFDKSFNESVHNGAQAFTKETGIEVREFEPQNDTQREQALRNLARRGQTPIVAVGFNQASALKTVSAEFPKLHFVILDTVVEAPNVQSIVFREEQGSYLAGMLAALRSGTGKVGFVGGMDVPLIRKFACGYGQGARAANPKAEVFQNMTGSTPTAWNDPVRGAELTRSQIERGADVIFQAAGATGLGVLQAAADAGKYGIGVDSNQNHLHPGHVLTSMVKRLDVAVQKAFQEAREGRFTPGTRVLGLEDDGISLAFDDNNAKIVTAEMRAKVDQARQDIVAGKIKVHDYMTDNSCPN
ncbi:Nucleoside-binding protein [Roseomonas mucosa]|uniref:Nucleoside-binding protein n=1 Tax=Roseomonas mucosa TaxID=207340 RepID=A0A4Y1N2Q0_9PROT|nr:BMP family ABC transporter substrate-binding protein [Roseomonas mucosa]AWV24505.1 Nucleoside-binding protein [Roseomonas mucosa]MDT8353966.1 BMP family ABC transporter substrate-binding protein [Roseomonas mucosa]MDU7524304.1 BMP family ABC transporter substrate-binding protein [Roseomonas mucosa]